MGTFRFYEPPQFSAEELDRIAVENRGIVRSLSGGYDARRQSGGIEPQHDYGFAWTDTYGVGNQGKLRLLGLTPRTVRLLHEGQLRHLDTLAATREQAYKAILDELDALDDEASELGENNQYSNSPCQYRMEELERLRNAYVALVGDTAA